MEEVPPPHSTQASSAEEVAVAESSVSPEETLDGDDGEEEDVGFGGGFGTRGARDPTEPNRTESEQSTSSSELHRE